MSVQTVSVPAGYAGDEMSRREFLNYAWLASLGVFTLQLGVVTFQFSLPRLAPGEFGGPVPLGSVDALPGAGKDPFPFPKSKIWWVVGDEGVRALFKVCTHLGCIYDWKPAENKFICPCHGSQFEREGKFIQGPAPRDLDRFVVRAVDANGEELARTNEAGDPLKVPAGASIIVETGLRIKGPQHA